MHGFRGFTPSLRHRVADLNQRFCRNYIRGTIYYLLRFVKILVPRTTRCFSAGFTITEVLLVMALMLIIGAFTFPVHVSLLQTQRLDDAASQTVHALRLARTYAHTGLHDSSFGVAFLSDSAVLFEGDSYALRTVAEDRIFHLPTNVSISGPAEIVFEKLHGTPVLAGTLTIQTDSDTVSVVVAENGHVTW